MCAAHAKTEFPPLLPAGLHLFTLDSLKATCVDAFPKSRTRAGIMANVIQVINRLTMDRVVGDLWINGSFLTEKIDPDDVDVVLRMDAEAYELGAPETQAAVDWFSGNLYASHNVDSYVFFVWPVGHKQHAAGQRLHDYWIKAVRTKPGV